MIGSLDDVAPDHPYPGIERRSIDGQGASLIWYVFEPGAQFPLHRHPQEQITVVEAGTVTLRLGVDDTQVLQPGGYSTMAGGIEHGITAGPDGARIMIALVPRRAVGEQPEVLENDDSKE